MHPIWIRLVLRLLRLYTPHESRQTSARVRTSRSSLANSSSCSSSSERMCKVSRSGAASSSRDIPPELRGPCPGRHTAVARSWLLPRRGKLRHHLVTFGDLILDSVTARRRVL